MKWGNTPESNNIVDRTDDSFRGLLRRCMDFVSERNSNALSSVKSLVGIGEQPEEPTLPAGLAPDPNKIYGALNDGPIEGLLEGLRPRQHHDTDLQLNLIWQPTALDSAPPLSAEFGGASRGISPTLAGPSLSPPGPSAMSQPRMR